MVHGPPRWWGVALLRTGLGVSGSIVVVALV
jgi:hypothetical protein